MRLIGPKERKLAHAKPSDAGASCLTARERENESRKKREGRALVSKGPWTRRVIILFQKQTTHPEMLIIIAGPVIPPRGWQEGGRSCDGSLGF